MKKKYVIPFVFLSIVLFILLSERTNIPTGEPIIIKFSTQDDVRTNSLTEVEAESVRKILSGNILYKENYSCGFSTDLSITIGSETYCIASDGCPFIYALNKQLFFKITSAEKREISSIFKKYGGVVHCD